MRFGGDYTPQSSSDKVSQDPQGWFFMVIFISWDPNPLQNNDPTNPIQASQIVKVSIPNCAILQPQTRLFFAGN